MEVDVEGQSQVGSSSTGPSSAAAAEVIDLAEEDVHIDLDNDMEDDLDDEADESDIQPADGGRKDSSAASIKALVAVLKKLVLDPNLGNSVTVADVKEAAFRKEDFEDFEYQVV
ncbi:hypothetical protein BGZ68_004515, partial [Mortierella alpina]